MAIYELSTEELSSICKKKSKDILIPENFVAVNFKTYLEFLGLNIEEVQSSISFHDLQILNFNRVISNLNKKHSETFIPIYVDEEPDFNRVTEDLDKGKFTSDKKYLQGNNLIRLKELLDDEVFDIIDNSDSPHFTSSSFDFRFLFKE